MTRAGKGMIRGRSCSVHIPFHFLSKGLIYVELFPYFIFHPSFVSSFYSRQEHTPVFSFFQVWVGVGNICDVIISKDFLWTPCYIDFFPPDLPADLSPHFVLCTFNFLISLVMYFSLFLPSFFFFLSSATVFQFHGFFSTASLTVSSPYSSLSLSLFAHPQNYTIFSPSGKVWRYFLSPLSFSSHSFLFSLLFSPYMVNTTLPVYPEHYCTSTLVCHPNTPISAHISLQQIGMKMCSPLKGETQRTGNTLDTLYIFDLLSDKGE